jgi:uncharacterized protein with PQ loop repeat
MHILQIIGLIAGVILPLWNIPLIARIQKRKSSKDISLYWAFGVWVCILLVLPAAWFSADPVFKYSWLINFALFSAVVFQVVRFR